MNKSFHYLNRLKYFLLFILLCIVGINNSNAKPFTNQQTEAAISGTITEQSGGTPLPGVSVVIKGTTIGTVTDLDGKYSINAKVGQILVFSYIGYLPQEVKITTQTVINISLAEDIIGLEEIVVTGYGTQKKSDLTGSIASVSGNDMAKLPAGNFDEVLKGRASGVFSGSETGAPGSTPVIHIRGIKSINGGDPLVVIDGIPSSVYSLNIINPSDIERVEVLKDASSQAIYGSSGGNGVIIITTKKGQQDKFSVELDYYYGYGVPMNRLSLCNTEQFYQIYKSLEGQEDFPEVNILGWNVDSIANKPNTDWQEEFTRNGITENIGLAVSGGGEISTYRLSTSYFKQSGNFPNTDFNRLTVKLNLEQKATKRIKLGQNLQFTRQETIGIPEWWYNNEWASPMGHVIKMHPFVEPYIEGAKPLQGNWGTSSLNIGLENPYHRTDITFRNSPTFRLLGDFNLEIEILKGLTVRSLINGDVSFAYSKQLDPKFYYTANRKSETNTLTTSSTYNRKWYLQNFVNYNFNISHHNINLMAGYESSYSINQSLTTEGTRLLSEAESNYYLNAAQNKTIPDFAFPDDVAYDAIFARFNWDYKGKYLITSNFRHERSSLFGENKRTGDFPSFSGGWKFSEEKFMESIPWLSFGKIRAGWGVIGNANIPPYRYQAVVINTNVYNTSLNNDSVLVGMGPHGFANPDLHWEEMNSANYGIDLAFLKNQLTLSVDIYKDKNIGMLMARPIPAISGNHQMNSGNEGGSTQFIDNIGQIENRGYEISVGLKTNTGNIFHDVNFNFGFNENKVIDIDPDTIIDPYTNLVSTFTAEGQPMGLFYGYVTDGLFQESDGYINRRKKWVMTNQPYRISKENGDTLWFQDKAEPGDVRFKDINGDTIFNDKDREVIGNPTPKVLIGFSYDITYKIFDLSMFWQGAFGHQIYQISKRWMYNNGGTYNWHTNMLDAWTPENPNTDQFRVSYADANDNDRTSDFYVEDGDYLRLKNLQLGCTIPQKLTNKINIQKFRIYIGVKDLLTITKYSGIDPEIANSRNPLDAGFDFSAYPRAITYTFGMNLVF